MKNLIVLALLFFGTVHVSAQDQIKWMTMNEALAAQKVKPKKIIMDAYTSWCGPCKLMDRNTFTNKDVIAYINTHYYAVKFDAEGTEQVTYQDTQYSNPNHQADKRGRNSQHDFARALKINGYPSLVFFKEDSGLIQPIVGYHPPQNLEIYLKIFAKNDYLKLTTIEAWDAYQKDFKGTFEN